MADADLQAFILARQEALTLKFEAGNVDAILEQYDEKEIDFSDHGTFVRCLGPFIYFHLP